METLYAIKIGYSTYSFMNHLSELDEIYKQISGVYLDVAQSHILSAMTSLKISCSSSTPVNEISHVINHLTDAYYIIHALKTKEKKLNILDILNGIDHKLLFKDTRLLKLWTLDIGLTIYYLYYVIQEQKSADAWLQLFKNDYLKDNMIDVINDETDDYSTYKDIFDGFKDYHNYQEIFSEEYSEKHSRYSRVMGMQDYWVYYYKVTEAGKECFEQYLIDSLKTKIQKAIKDESYN